MGELVPLQVEGGGEHLAALLAVDDPGLWVGPGRVPGGGPRPAHEVAAQHVVQAEELELETNLRNHGESLYTRVFSWLKVATTAFTLKNLLRHYAKQT